MWYTMYVMEMLTGVSSIRKVLNEKTGADFCQSQTSLLCHRVVDTPLD
jgi:hypothetical protein